MIRNLSSAHAPAWDGYGDTLCARRRWQPGLPTLLLDPPVAKSFSCNDFEVTVVGRHCGVLCIVDVGGHLRRRHPEPGRLGRGPAVTRSPRSAARRNFLAQQPPPEAPAGSRRRPTTPRRTRNYAAPTVGAAHVPLPMAEDAEQHDAADGQDMEADPPDGEQLSHASTLPSVPVGRTRPGRDGCPGQPVVGGEHLRARSPDPREETVRTYQRYARLRASPERQQGAVEVLDDGTSDRPRPRHPAGDDEPMTATAGQCSSDASRERPRIAAAPEHPPPAGRLVEPHDCPSRVRTRGFGNARPPACRARRCAGPSRAPQTARSKPRAEDRSSVDRLQRLTGGTGPARRWR